MIDLTTRYLGLHLRSPLVVSASPLAKSVANLQKMEQAGAAAVVLHSLFEEQITAEEQALDRMLSEGSESHYEALNYFPEFQSYGMGPDAYLEHVRKAKKAVGIPVIGSLNGVSTGGWIRFAKLIEEAGADALELNIYFLPTSAEIEGREIEANYCDLVEAVKTKVKIPVAVKLAPYFTSMANLGARLDRAGANALVLFNRFYQPDFDLEALEVTPHLTLSTSAELRLRLHWVALLSRIVRSDLAITGGAHTAEDVVKGVMAGAQVVMLTSALLQKGIAHLSQLEADLIAWMRAHEYESIRQMCGSMNVAAVREPAAFERANYLKVLGSYQ